MSTIIRYGAVSNFQNVIVRTLRKSLVASYHSVRNNKQHCISIRLPKKLAIFLDRVGYSTGPLIRNRDIGVSLPNISYLRQGVLWTNFSIKQLSDFLFYKTV